MPQRFTTEATETRLDSETARYFWRVSVFSVVQLYFLYFGFPNELDSVQLEIERR